VTSADSLKRAANNILTRSLGLRKDQSLLVFADSGSVVVAEVIARAAREHGIVPSVMFVPRFLQAELGLTESLPLPVEAAIREADAVLSCLSDQSEHMPYRLRVLRTSWSRRTKLAHAPGMTLDVLRKADTDYGLISEHARRLALALALGRLLEIVTFDGEGREHRLSVPIGGWEYPPEVSDGVISDGAWGNVPPGEVYVVPQGGEGVIAVNGSLPGRVLAPGEELLLAFRAGWLHEMRPKTGPAARYLRETQISYARERGDREWMNLAEIGFGLNPAVHELIGVPLVDGKKADTVHIALGHSASLGGNVDSVIHCDMVIEGPTVRVDGRTLLNAGQWQVNEADWRLDYRTASPPAGWWESLVGVRRGAMHAERDQGRSPGAVPGCLVCRWKSGRGRWDSIPVGAELTARLAARLYDLLPDDSQPVEKAALLASVASAEGIGLDGAVLPGLLWIMRQYDVIRFVGERL
jgi:leucyl aminopeptidase (aminopeptidase T)